MTQNSLQYPRVPSDNCYLYILATGEKEFTIGMAGNPKLGGNAIYGKSKAYVQAAKQTPAKLVYYRCFEDTLTALAFKRLLESMAPRSVEYLIRRSNPQLETLNFDNLSQ